MKHTKILVVLSLFWNVSSMDAGCENKDIQLFDGKTLDGWVAVNPSWEGLWRVVDGVIVGGDGERSVDRNTFLCTESVFLNFEFRCLFRLTGDSEIGFVNSGIQYRTKIEEWKVIGYQADIGDRFWGDIYDEHRRGKLVQGNVSELETVLNRGGWNSYIIRCVGDLHETYINGVKVACYVEDDSSISDEGVIGFQLHRGGNVKLEIKAPVVTQIEE